MEHQPTKVRRVRALAAPKTSVLFLLAGLFQTPTQSPFLNGYEQDHMFIQNDSHL